MGVACRLCNTRIHRLPQQVDELERRGTSLTYEEHRSHRFLSLGSRGAAIFWYLRLTHVKGLCSPWGRRVKRSRSFRIGSGSNRTPCRSSRSAPAFRKCLASKQTRRLAPPAAFELPLPWRGNSLPHADHPSRTMSRLRLSLARSACVPASGLWFSGKGISMTQISLSLFTSVAPHATRVSSSRRMLMYVSAS
jgi:hypothetical protein